MWTGQFSSVRESLRMGMAICERWVSVCETLSSQFWRRYAPHPWKGDTCSPKTLKKLFERLEEVREAISLLCLRLLFFLHKQIKF